MFTWLGGWLRKLRRSNADQAPGASSAPQKTIIHQHGVAGTVQVGRIDTMNLVQHLASPGAAPTDAELQSLQLSVMRSLDAAGNRREAIEAFMRREFGTSRVMHLSQPQLYRTQRYCDTIQARRKPRGQSEARP